MSPLMSGVINDALVTDSESSAMAGKCLFFFFCHGGGCLIYVVLTQTASQAWETVCQSPEVGQSPVYLGN